MANELDELNVVVNEKGNDINVINKQLPVKVGFGSLIFEIFLWFPLIIPGLIFLFMKISAGNEFRRIQQQIQHNASQVDNYIEQRVIILQNAVSIVNKAICLDKEVMTEVAKLRAGAKAHNEAERTQINQNIDRMFRDINLQVEQYPELKAHNALAEAMKQNSYLQREITAAREIYNDSILLWNSEIFRWPTKMIVAARAHYTTRIPFYTSSEIKAQARKNFFE
ncbi:LemA family protein [Mycoplasmopsis verecunda]|uniref:LemA protein n=1 Tax=Mycoplasmopsis verecunda TaxID=171291 RepID=A0A1T4L440_9BACT|nr:LemA family protein [Mycoplasmopsis verecunda]WPB54444.1 LemA family protein [Mycoplasmopsis verecunda]SJZ49280.1 LemA protein [Mycoplasmopsis verecunda]